MVRFPGSLDHDSAVRAAVQAGATSALVHHRERALPAGTTAVVLPGGFSYGDHLRCGAIASRAPIMDAVRAFAAGGGRVLGICNGFQILCEAGLLPGVLRPNRTLSFICRQVTLEIDDASTTWTGGLPSGSTAIDPDQEPRRRVVRRPRRRARGVPVRRVRTPPARTTGWPASRTATATCSG